MDPLDEILSEPAVISRAGGRFQPKIKPRPRKQKLAPSLPTSSHDNKVDSTQPDLDACGSIPPLCSTTDDPDGRKNLTNDYTNEVGVFNFHPSSSTAHEAMPLDQNGLGSTQSLDGQSSDGKIMGENADIFSGLEYFDDFHNQDKNDADSARLRQAASSNENGNMVKEGFETELPEGVADIAMDAISVEAATASGDTRCTHEASAAAHQSDTMLEDSMIYVDGFIPVNEHTEVPLNAGSIASDSYGDILVDDFNSEDPEVVSRGVSGLSGKKKPSMESNIFQHQEMFAGVGEEREHSKSTRKLRKRVSHQLLDEPEASANETSSFPDEPSDNYDLDADDYVDNETSRGGTSLGKKASRKLSKPFNEIKKRSRKQKEVNEEVSALQAEKRPKKFSHSTRRSRRKVDKVLLETPEDEIDFQKISLRDLIIYHEYKEKLEKKEATSTRSAVNQKSAVNQRTETLGEEVYDGEEGTAGYGQDRGSDDDETPDVVDMTSAYFNYHSFMDKTPRPKWSKQDTHLFYEAVRQFGTDFCMIQQLFPGRTRHQIKLKFKNEERHHPLRLSDALTNRAKDHSYFKSLIGQLQEAASKTKHESNEEDEMTENVGEEDMEELSPETNEEVAKSGEEDANMNKEEYGGEVQSPLKADGSDDDDDDSCRWDEYKFDF